MTKYYYVANLKSEVSFARKGSASVTEAIQLMFDELNLRETFTGEVSVQVYKRVGRDHELLRTLEVSVRYEYEFDPDSDTQPHSSSWEFCESPEESAMEEVRDALLRAKELMEMGLAPATFLSKELEQLVKMTMN